MRTPPSASALFGVTVLGGTLALASPAGGNDEPSFSEVIEALREAETRLSNLRLVSEVVVESWVPETASWQPTERRLRGVVQKRAAPASQARVDVTEVQRWQDGEAPYFERHYEAGYDGESGRVLYHREGAVGTMQDAHRAAILDEWPLGLRTWSVDALAGRPFSLHYYDSDGSQTLSQVLAHASEQGAEFEVVPSVGEQDGLVSLVLEGPDGREEAWSFDRERDFALVGYVYTRPDPETGQELVEREMKVESLTEAAPGVWYPTAGWFQRSPTERYVYAVAEIEANAPDFDESVFELSIPPGYRVHDHRIDEIYVAGYAPDELDRQIASLAEEVSVLEEDAPEPTEPAPSPRGEDPGPAPVGAQSTGRMPLMSLLATRLAMMGVAIVAVVVLAVMRRRRRSAGIGLAVLLGLSAAAGPDTAQEAQAAQEAQEEAPSPPGLEWVDNCGLNVVALALRLAGVEASTGELARHLEAGERLERPVSMQRIAEVLNRYGAAVAGYHVESSERILSVCEPDDILIVHQQRQAEAEIVGHYILVLVRQEDVVLVDAFAEPPVVVARDGLGRAPMMESASGRMLRARFAADSSEAPEQ